MSGATRGTVLSGRYRLDERIHTNQDGALWRALDATLDRTVSIRVMRPGHPFTADVVDAARRAALIDDSRLVRVLDVGNDGDLGFVVSEYVRGESLETLVERSPLSPGAIRRIVGEVAQGLDGAAARGLHHLQLTPRSVTICQDGTVKIFGTAVEAAAAGLEPDHAATASRTDAIALIGLLYSGLTGRWPLGDAGFPPAPRGESGAPVPPGDLVLGVPNDLDTLCVVTLGSHDDGPRSPAELVRQLSPWPTVAQAPLRSTARRAPFDDVVVLPPLADESLALPTRSNGTRPSLPREAAQRPARPFAAPRTAGGTPLPTIDSASRPAARQPARPAGPARPNASPARPDPGRPNPGTVKPAGPAGRPPERVAERSRGNGAPRGNGPAGPTGSQILFSGWSNTAAAPSALESTGPFPIIIPAEPPPREQSRIVIFGIVGVLIVGLLLAGFSLRDFGSRGSNAGPAITPLSSAPITSTTQPPAPSASTSSPKPSASSNPTSTAAVKIASVRAIDPQGDGDEDSADSAKVLDGNASTIWRSDTYRTAEFGGLKKGVGLAFKLKDTAKLSSVVIDSAGSGGSVQIFTADGPDISGAKLVGNAALDGGRVTVKTAGAAASNYVILWFTKLPSVSGKYRIEVSGVRLT